VRRYVGMKWLFESNEKAKKVIKVNSSKKKLSGTRANKIKVKILGCVKKPGIYEIRKGTTLSELIEVCGYLEYADIATLDNIILKDGEEYYIPFRKVQNGEKININKASVEELCRLPYVSKSIAKEIINYRVKYGRFDTVEEIMNLKGIGEKRFIYIREYIATGE